MYFLCIFIPLTLLTYYWFGKKSLSLDVKRTGVGHRTTMIEMLPSILVLFEGPRSFCFRQPFDSVIEGLWYYICFVLPRYFVCVTWPFYFRKPSGRNPKDACEQSVSFFMFLSCIRFFFYLFGFLFLSCKSNTLFTHSKYKIIVPRWRYQKVA